MDTDPAEGAGRIPDTHTSPKAFLKARGVLSIGAAEHVPFFVLFFLTLCFYTVLTSLSSIFSQSGLEQSAPNCGMAKVGWDGAATPVLHRGLKNIDFSAVWHLVASCTWWA